MPRSSCKPSSPTLAIASGYLFAPVAFHSKTGMMASKLTRSSVTGGEPYSCFLDLRRCAWVLC